MARYLFACLFMCLLPGFSPAYGTVLDEKTGFMPIWQDFQVLIDTDKIWHTPSELPDTGWQTIGTRVPNFAPSKHSYWLRGELHNQSQQTHWLLYLDFPLLENFDIYLRPEGQTTWQAFHLGRFIPRKERPVHDMMPTLPLSLENGQRLQIVLHVNTRTTVQIPLFVASQEALDTHTFTQHAGNFIFYGMMLALILYNLFLFFAIRKAAFGYYVVYLTSLSLYILSMKGHSPLLLLTESREIELLLVIINMGLTPLFAALFIRHFLHIEKYVPELLLPVKILVFSAALSIVMGMSGWYFIWVKMVTLNSLSFAVLMLVAGLLALKRGNRSALYFLMAWTMIIISTFAYAGLINGLLPYNDFTSNVMEIGTASEALLLSLALADAIRRIRQEKLRAQEIAAQEINAANRALQKVVEALETSNAEKDEFLSIASHELRTPMHALIASLDLLRKNPEDIQYLESLQAGANMLSRHVENMVAYCEINTDKLAQENIDFNLNELIDELHTYAKGQLKNRPVQFIVEKDANLPAWLKGDRLNLHRLLLNLLDNACKFTPAGSIIFGIHQMHREETSVYLNFSLRDTGQGIDDNLRDKLFQVFSMGDRSMNRRQSGLGLGLAVGAKLAQHLNSFLHLDSSPRQGTLVDFKITFAIAHAPNIVKLKRSHILVVEDNHTNALLLCKMLNKLGHSSDVAEDGAVALQKLTTQNYDAILMDCQMPILNGWQVTEAIRKTPSHYQQIPIIAVTANASSDDRARCKNVGMDDFLQKPLRLNTLDTTLQRWLGTPQKAG
jgi:two-component system, sensor histidine kinase LadS